MTQVSPKHDVLSSFHHFFMSVQNLAVSHGLQLRSNSRHNLNAHLRYDVGEDDMRPAAPQTLLQQEVARANALDTMISRSF